VKEQKDSESSIYTESSFVKSISSTEQSAHPSMITSDSINEEPL